MDNMEVEIPLDEQGLSFEEAQPQVELELISEETPIEQAEEEPETVEEKPKKRKFHVDGKSRISQLTREKYEFQNLAKVREEEADNLRREVERLQKLTEQSSQAAMAHFNDSVKMKTEQAKLKLSKAIQEGDVDEHLRATEELADAKAKQAQIDSWNANQQYVSQQRAETFPEKQYIEQRRPQVEMDIEQSEQPELTPEAYDWLERNQWFNPKSPRFNPQLASEVQNYEALLYNKLQRSGQQDKILSKEYFDDIDRYINTEIYGEPEQPQSRMLNMRQTRSPVSPVNHGMRQQQNATPKFRLPEGMSEHEFKNYIQNLGVSEKDFMANLKEHLTDQQIKMQNLIRQGRGY